MEKFIFFWGGPFSQFYPCKFFAEVDNKALEFNCAEQYMMYCKAICFRDYEIATQIMKSANPKKIKDLGRKVQKFNDKLWMTVAQEIVYTGNYHKFTQNMGLRTLLFSSEGTFVEASPYDIRWGIGLLSSDPRALYRDQWRGQNLLGEILTKLKDKLIEEDKIRTTVVHCMKEDYDIYIGRGNDPKTGEPSIWGNPFSFKEDTLAEFKAKDRNDSINKHREWIKTQPHLLANIYKLKGKRLGCWCSPKLCHGHTLAAIADGLSWCNDYD